MKIQIINKDYPKLIEIFENVNDNQVDEFIKKNQEGKYIIKLLSY